ncbi:uncharacterized protein LOC115712060 [Cannabis sativa]|uniref:uncharacterized protein LOC115712060 n=1 Tax=Cannabis sativa TaxID=3483 RepID=UPI0029CA391D|nr:uncharacterized protein LOC115712060 [Cannabis sativa]
MGNCQAIDAAALVIQHPCGKIERLYWTISASEVMRLNPGHYVSLIIPLPISDQHQDKENHQQQQTEEIKTVRFTRVKLLRPTETLALGHAYRLVTTQEVMKVLRAKKYAKAKKQVHEKSESSVTAENNNNEMSLSSSNKAMKTERSKQRLSSSSSSSSSSNASAMRSKSWRPSLQSIYEATN